MTTLQSEIAVLLNRVSAENASNTPDFILAAFLMRCLDAWNEGVYRREAWYGRAPYQENVGPEVGVGTSALGELVVMAKHWPYRGNVEGEHIVAEKAEMELLALRSHLRDATGALENNAVALGVVKGQAMRLFDHQEETSIPFTGHDIKNIVNALALTGKVLLTIQAQNPVKEVK